MGYYEFDIKVAGESLDALLNLMSGAGCLGAIEKNGGVIAYFSDTRGINEIKGSLALFKTILRDSGLDGSLSFGYVFLSERDWNETWKKKFKPVEAGRSFYIIPPWEKGKEGRISLIIDPGMAFGTGHHETTRTCLALIERFSGSTAKNRFLDVGTGTGILAIAASKLGYKHVTAVDIDPLAVDAARRNAELNGTGNIEIIEGGISSAQGSYDFIAANLMSEILIKIAPEAPQRLDLSGAALLSGMLSGQEYGVIEAMEKEGLRFDEKFEDGRWVSVVVRH